MNDMHADHQDSNHQAKSDWYQVGKWGAIGILAYYLLTEHYAHVIGILPLLLLAACPLMHFFMHGGHGAHGGHHHNPGEKGNK